MRIQGARQREVFMTLAFRPLLGAMAYDAVARANSPYPKGRTAMTSNSIVRVLNRGANPAFQTFPCISRPIRRHIALISES